MPRLIHLKTAVLLVLVVGFFTVGRPLTIIDLVSLEGGSKERHVIPAPTRGAGAGKIPNEFLPIRREPELDFQNELHERLYLVKSQGHVYAGNYAVPGYYTLMVFSSAWCLPCKELRKKSPALLDRYRNLIIVDIDIGKGDDLDPLGVSLLADLGEKSTLPAALLFNPFGLYMNRQKPSGVAGAICGYEEILTRIEAAIKRRKNRKVIPMDGDIVRSRLSDLQKERRHYSLQETRIADTTE
jgi:hypothetical protein